jgi:hypothetical protein
VLHGVIVAIPAGVGLVDPAGRIDRVEPMHTKLHVGRTEGLDIPAALSAVEQMISMSRGR